MNATPDDPVIACTLSGRDLEDRLAWIARLNRDALLGHERSAFELRLQYAPGALDRVREMVRNERTCCGFLGFELMECPGEELRVTITVPAGARSVADELLRPFLRRVDTDTKQHR